MTIHLAADHAGYNLKEEVKEFLTQKGLQVKDHGALSLDNNDDYPDFINPAAKAVAAQEGDKAIIFGGSGQGEAMAANRFKGVRAVVLYVYNEEIIRLSRAHNDSNVLSIAARLISSEETLKAIDLWLNTKFSEGERHIRRISKF